ncbi:olfactory receptor 10G8-like [Mastomys coucha]|uniref:olfactory receptor 10G8-like n=1 Tax=Mastomys coucha TaxID=35658 RepID=UPI001262A2F7|nr:olfactory receptor 10G8-like [Mastomys coucha]
MSNVTLVTTFFLSGIPHAPALDTMLFVTFLVIYILTVLGNFLILMVIRVDSHLHTPMYYFLTNLSFIDMWFSTVTVPKMLMTLVSTEGGAISFHSCVAQLYCFHFFFVPCVFIYLRPGSRDAVDGVVAVFYTVLTPLLNPVVYTLRNKEVKKALVKLKDKVAHSQSH